MRSERAVFVADAHLQPGFRPGQNRMLKRFLHEVCFPGDVLVLLGDLFHCWFERRGRVVGDFSEVLEAFGAAAARGVEIHYVSGNRDFAVGAGRSERRDVWAHNPRFPGFFAPVGPRAQSVLVQYGVEPHGTHFRVRIRNRNVTCVHGDIYCTGDPGYALLRWLTQGPLGRLAMSWGPFLLARLIVGRLQALPVSRLRHYPAAGGGMDWSRASAELATGADLLVCGHLHHPGTRPLLLGERRGQLVIVGPWCAGWEYAVLEESGPRFGCLAPPS